MIPPAYYLLRVRRDGPLVPARFWLCDHDPADPANKLDRGRLSPYPRAEIAGREVEPEVLLDRIGIWARRGDRILLPFEVVAALADPTQQTPRPEGHWAHATLIPKAEYDYRLAHIEWLRRHRPADPRVHPNRPLKPSELPLPSFEREHAIAG